MSKELIDFKHLYKEWWKARFAVGLEDKKCAATCADILTEYLFPMIGPQVAVGEKVSTVHTVRINELTNLTPVGSQWSILKK